VLEPPESPGVNDPVAVALIDVAVAM
jgi:hypothetical protein